MYKRLRIFSLILFAIALSSALFCQDDTEQSTTDLNTSKQAASNFFTLLYNNDVAASDYIYWDYLSVNGTDYSVDYWDAYDYDDVDYFVEQTITDIHSMLRYDGDTNDPFIGWEYGPGDTTMLVKAHNKKKSIEMTFTNMDGEVKKVIEIVISDIEE